MLRDKISHLAMTAVMVFSVVHSLKAGDDGSGQYLQSAMPEAWQEYDSNRFDPAGSVDRQWWRQFDDSLLDSLIDLGVQRNYDLSVASRRMQVAKNTLGASKGQWLPTVGINAGWQRSQTSGRTTPADMPAARGSFWSGSVDMSWEIDVFGKIASQVKESGARFRATRDQWAAAMLSLEAQIADTYFHLRSLQAQMEVARTHSSSQLAVVKITEARFESGLASKLDVAQAKRVYYSTIASIPQLGSSIKASINALAVLVGEYPEALQPVLETPKALPQYIQLVGTGMPMNLLDRRPDIKAAREQIAASAASVGIAKKEFLPSLRLDGSIGTQAHDGGDLFTSNSFTWSVAPTLSWTIFDGLSRKYNLASAKEQLQIDIDNYNLVVLTAVEETDNALNAYTSDLKCISSLEEVVRQSEEAMRLSLDLYKLDLSAFTNVVDAQLTYLESENSVIEAKYNALSALISIYKALGGGWN